MQPYVWALEIAMLFAPAGDVLKLLESNPNRLSKLPFDSTRIFKFAKHSSIYPFPTREWTVSTGTNFETVSVCCPLNYSVLTISVI
jgi:hypothetical protein